MNLFYHVFLYFLIYSILGWICEVIYCAILDRNFTNRGFLNGPYCPIYGFGAMATVYLLINFRNNIFIVFILGMILMSIIEYITSFVMEKIFNTRWWDYSDKFLNINGRVCLRNSILFGILSVVTLYILHPFVIDLITKLSYDIVQVISLISIIIMTADIVTTITTMINLKQRLQKLKDLKEQLDMQLSEITKPDIIPMMTEVLQEQIRDLIIQKRYFERRLLRAFSHLKSSKFNLQFEELRKSIENSKKKKANN